MFNRRPTQSQLVWLGSCWLLSIFIFSSCFENTQSQPKLYFRPDSLPQVSDSAASGLTEEQIKNLECGSYVDYWSMSCGPIGSSSSKECSHGGELFHPSSCTTHFSPFSRGCGFLWMGCQSLCRRRSHGCVPGEIQFSTPRLTSCRAKHQLSVPILRQQGSDRIVSVGVFASDPTIKFPSGPRVSWSSGDSTPKLIDIDFSELPETVNEFTLFLKDPVIAFISHVSSIQVTLIQNHPQIEVGFREQTYTVREDGGRLEIELVARMPRHLLRPPSPENPDVHRVESFVQVSHIGGTAFESVDFEFSDLRIMIPTDPRTDLPEGDENEKIETTIKFEMVVYDNEWWEPDETVILGISDYYNCVSTAYPYTIIVLVDDIQDNVPAQKQKAREILIGLLENLEYDKNFEEDLIHSFESRTVQPGHLILSQGTRSNYLYVIESGEVQVTHKTSEGSKEYIVGTYTTGEMFGELGILFNSSNLYSYTAVTPVTIWVLSQLNFKKFVSTKQEIVHQLEEKFLDRVIRTLPHKPPILLFPGLASSRLIAWKEKRCMGFPFSIGDRVWISIEKLLQTLISDPHCWLDCLALGLNQTDPSTCKLRPGEGLEALTDLAPGMFTGNPTTIFGGIIRHYAREYGYDSNSLVAMPYDWRLSPSMLEERDSYFTNMKFKIEVAVKANNYIPSIAFAHSMGNNAFLYFVTWMQQTYPTTYEEWFSKNIMAYVGFGAPLLGAVEPMKSAITGLPMGLPISELQAKSVQLTFGSLPWLFPIPSDINQTEFTDRTPLVVDLFNRTRLDFNLQSITDGRLFQSLGDVTKDPRYRNMHQVLTDHYLTQNFNPLSKPPPRPPIAHVVMIYGINVPTVVSYQYTETALADKSELILKETITEEAGGLLHSRENAVMGAKNKIGETNRGKSGDGTVPYRSLSYAHQWHLNTPNVQHQPRKVIEYYDSTIGRTVERNVATIMNTVEPEHKIYRSGKSSGGDKNFQTIVLEVEGLEHRDIVRQPFTFKLVDTFLRQTMKQKLIGNSLIESDKK